ncbi:hypothetical protein VO64_2922 [Pseudomonas synxantha]|uniref:Mobile element protein n=1 Tax=Pseudomonas synxantha TaxID=47883 RepID=A0AAU8TZF1_9PSED|nr:hypothetical protein VO64_2922 [Pseudomonas synxantha]
MLALNVLSMILHWVNVQLLNSQSFRDASLKLHFMNVQSLNWLLLKPDP